MGQTPKSVLYLEVRSLIDTFGIPNPQLTSSHETLAEMPKKIVRLRTIAEKNKKFCNFE